MGAGQYTERVTLQLLVQGKDAHGGMVSAWTDVCTVWASEPKLYSGEDKKATTAAGGQLPVARTEIRMRWRDDVTTGQRVLCGSTVYNIRSLAGSRRGGQLILVCDTGANDGR